MELQTFEEYINEALTIKSDFKKLSDTNMKHIIKYLNGTREDLGIFTFNVNDIDYYCILFDRDGMLETHFGEYDISLFKKVLIYLKSDNKEQLKLILDDERLVFKDGLRGNNKTSFMKILSYVYSILLDRVNKKPPSLIKIMGVENMYNIYKKFVKQLITNIDYHIIEEDISTEYTNRNGKTIKAKAIILKYDFA